MWVLCLFVVCFFFLRTGRTQSKSILFRYRHKGSDSTGIIESMGESECTVSMSFDSACFSLNPVRF